MFHNGAISVNSFSYSVAGKGTGLQPSDIFLPSIDLACTAGFGGSCTVPAWNGGGAAGVRFKDGLLLETGMKGAGAGEKRPSQV